MRPVAHHPGLDHRDAAHLPSPDPKPPQTKGGQLNLT